MQRFINDFWKTISLSEKIEFSIATLIIMNLIVAILYIALITI